MADQNNDQKIDRDELRTLLRYASIFLKDEELDKVFELMDFKQEGKLDYLMFSDVIEKDAVLPIADIIKKRRKERGVAIDQIGFGVEEPEDPKEKEEYEQAQKTMNAIFGSEMSIKGREADFLNEERANNLEDIMRLSVDSGFKSQLFSDD